MKLVNRHAATISNQEENRKRRLGKGAGDGPHRPDRINQAEPMRGDSSAEVFPLNIARVDRLGDGKRGRAASALLANVRGRMFNFKRVAGGADEQPR